MDFVERSRPPTAFAQRDIAVSSPPPDAGKMPPETQSQPSEEIPGDGEMTSPELEHSDVDNNADVISNCSSAVEYGQEPFDSYQHKVTQLCRDIGYGEPLKIERMKGGSFNRIVGLEFASPKKLRYILRIPRNGTEFDESQDIKDQVATLDYVLQHLPVASVAAFDSTQNNVLASAYVLQERIPGVLLEDVFYDLPLAEKLQIATKIAELMIKMESITLATPGRIAANEDAPDLQHQHISSSMASKIRGYRGAKFGISAQFSDLEEAPFTALMRTIFDARKQQFIDEDEHWMVEKMEKLQKIASQMEEVGLVRITDRHCVMWHWDFAARNIMVSRASAVADSASAQGTLENKLSWENLHLTAVTSGKKAEVGQLSEQIETTVLGPWVITGILDWDRILSVPRILARQPPLWLWCNEGERSSAWSGNLDIPPSRELSQDELLIKAYFDQIMAKHDPAYTEDAYGRGPWLRRLARFALYGFSEFGCFERYDAFVKEWAEHLSTISGARYASDSDDDTDSGEEEDFDEDEDDMEDEGSDGDSEHSDVLDSESTRED